MSAELEQRLSALEETYIRLGNFPQRTIPKLVAALREAVKALEEANEAMNTCMDHNHSDGMLHHQTYDSEKVGLSHLNVRSALSTIETLLKK